MKITETRMQVWLSSELRSRYGHQGVVPNFTGFRTNEADLISTLRSGFSWEIEIKCSAADLRAEQRAIEAGRDGLHYKQGASRTKIRKHGFYFKRMRGEIPVNPKRLVYSPNYFWIAVPPDLVDLAIETENHVGILRVAGFGDVERVRKAVRLHDVKMEPKDYASLLSAASAKLQSQIRSREWSRCSQNRSQRVFRTPESVDSLIFA